MQTRCNLYFLLVFATGVVVFLLRGNSSPVEQPKQNIILSDDPVITPDLRLVNQYRTSQLLYINEKPVPSRKVHYRYTGKTTPKLILVVGLNSDLDQATLHIMLKDKVEYAQRHNYGLFCRYLQDTAPTGVPASDAMGVAKLGLVRQVFNVFPEAEWALSIDAKSTITNLDFEADTIVSPKFLYANAKRSHSFHADQPHVKTFEHADPRKAKLVLSSTKNGVSTGWFYVRNSLEAKALLEFGGDPLNQQHSEFHQDPESPSLMLTHMIVWHPRFLAQTAIIDQEHLSRPAWRPKDFLFFGDVRQGLKVKELDHIY